MPPARPGIWFRILLPGGALGPGKIALMQAIADTGSVSAAARRLRMSHVRSIKLVAELNALGRTPLIDTRTGGAAGGGACLTLLGQAVVEQYRLVDAAMDGAAKEPLAALAAMLTPT